MSSKFVVRDYEKFAHEAREICPKRVFTSPLTTFAYGVDASCYSTTPKIVVYAINEEEIKKLIALANACNTPITFKGAGSSLSGQASSESVLIIANQGWKKITVLDAGKRIRLGCGVVGEDANKALKPFGKKIGPDPATIATALIGGIFNNNSSGMCCGVEQNSYHTINSVRVITAQGVVLDTSRKESMYEFLQTQSALVEEILNLRASMLQNPELIAQIKRKYKIKNTVGFSINALVDFEDIQDILNHIFVGSEGCLAFVSEVVYTSVEDFANKACGLLFFEDLSSASKAITILAELGREVLNAAEIMDYACLASCQRVPELAEILQDIPPNTTCILLQTQHETFQGLEANLSKIKESLQDVHMPKALYTHEEKTYNLWWKIRKSLLPLSAGNRPKESIVITEDVCFEIPYFCQGIELIQNLFKRFQFSGIIFGHALSGNVHFVITPNLNDEEQKKRFGLFMEDLAKEVVALHGAFKAEHGTGRMVAPFVELEWGKEAYEIHKKIKEIFDPKGLLNPDVIISQNKNVHLQHFKASQSFLDLVDHCMDCGFCEKSCPSRFLTLTPRQRIASSKEIQRLSHSQDPQDILRAKEMEQEYQYFGVETCATCSMCKIACPLEIDTANIALELSKKSHHKGFEYVYKHFGGFLKVARGMLSLGNFAQSVIPPMKLYHFSKSLHQKFHFLPIIPPFLPQKNDFFAKQKRTCFHTPVQKNEAAQNEAAQAHKITPHPQASKEAKEIRELKEVIYFSTCMNRSFKPSKLLPNNRPLQEVMESIAKKAGIRLIYPKNLEKLCCKKPFSHIEAIKKDEGLARDLMEMSQNGKIPILVDHSACSAHMILEVAKNLPLEILDSTEFLYLATKNLHFKKIEKKIAIHQMCALKKLHKEHFIIELVQRCSDHYHVLEKLSCCGFSGYKGFFTPELNECNITPLSLDHCDLGVSSSSTCEIGLSLKLPFLNVAYLVDEALT
ncbi:D-lactate dehydrogenase [Helicobacter mustelae]|uniref:FAD-binding and (Fe-S)-binding domain-containing protein n=1 Tax=Helicobacter mustelae TaxID=217 RepID=UPI000E07337A|nr:FAD-binding and (Fe-S)-binding domain-containing protein [Helicobacter mustelae]STP12729.1 D-lactate dehydrogenase [Helicobacter mustelae]